MAWICGKRRPTNPVYGIKKSLGEVDLKEGIRFDKKEEVKYMYDKLKWTGNGWDEIEIYDVPRNVIDDDTKTTHDLRLVKNPEQPWGFFNDWYEKVALPRKFKGDEVIGFYIDRKRKFHFKVLSADKGEGE